MGSEPLRHVNETKYVGFTFFDLTTDDKQMTRQMRSVYTRNNRLLHIHCSIGVKSGFI